MSQLSLARYSVNLNHLKGHWFWRVVLLPVILTRFIQLLVVYFSNIIPALNGGVPPVWNFFLKRFISVWANWDSGWYLDIIVHGYHLNGPIGQVESNIAFYPLYPYLVKIISWPLFSLYPKPIVLISFGVLLSNLFLLGALYFLYKFIVLVFDDVNLAERSIIYMLVFPSAIFFSCFYTESTFLFFAISAFYFARKNNLLLAAIMAAFISISRPLGVFIILPLGLIYLDSIHWNFHKIKPNILLYCLAPAVLLIYMTSLYPATGDFLAIFKIQASWGRHFASPLATVTFPPWDNYSQWIYEVDRVNLFLFFIMGIVSLVKLPSRSLGIFPLLIVLPLFFTGQLASVTRYCAVLFPNFILMAKFGRHKIVNLLIMMIFFTLQILFMAAWSRGYWVQ